MASTTTRKRGGPVAFRYFEPAKRRASQYEEVTVHTQWDPENFATQGWFNRDAQGRGSWSDDSTALRAENWWVYRDPNQEWFRPFVNRQAAMGDAVVQRGNPADGKALYFALSGAQIVGAAAIGQGMSAAKDLRLAQMLIERGAPASPGSLADPGMNLKQLLKAA